MKYLLILLLPFTALSLHVHAQPGDSTIRKINAAVEQAATVYAKKLAEQGQSPEASELSIDTFRVERFMTECLNAEISDAYMSQVIYTGAKQYDSLLNKYYKKLLTVLKEADRKTLVQAQKNWLAFRDSELKLIRLISKDEYAGGGTIQRLNESFDYLNLVKRRTIVLAQHYLRATQAY